MYLWLQSSDLIVFNFYLNELNFHDKPIFTHTYVSKHFGVRAPEDD